MEVENGEREDDDDSDIPLEVIIRHETGIEVDHLSTPPSRFCVAADAVEVSSNGDFSATAPVEDVWAYKPDGTCWGNVMPMKD
jgi:hypothetical protein